MSVAQTILQQLGGNKFRVMTGAKDFIGSDNALSFSLPSNFAKGGINRIRVVLDADDTYVMGFHKVRGTSVIDVARESGLYFDMLQSTFTQHTGLDTHL